MSELLAYFNKKNKTFYSDDPYTISVLRRAYYGKIQKSVLYLDLIEVFYLTEMRNLIVKDDTSLSELTVNELLYLASNIRHFFTLYYAYRDWRERGLIINFSKCFETENKQIQVEYPTANEIILPKNKIQGFFFIHDAMTICEQNDVSEYLYSNYWFGQLGSYKNWQRGTFLKLDAYETIYLQERGILELVNVKERELFEKLLKKIKDFKILYEVYSEWRNLGYVIKTGFKFGTHFRVYLPDAKPSDSESQYVHSTHVLHCIPENVNIQISDLSRAIRVAHSVKKTFILAIPSKRSVKVNESNQKIANDVLLYHVYTRKESNSDSNFLSSSSREEYLLCSFHEDDSVNGHTLELLISQAKEIGKNLIFAIVDRETSVTYYLVKKLILHGSKFNYYELEWIQP
ncbi:MAG: tRNA-intron lyase [Candidatus Anstonellales archaeon]